MNKMQVEYDPVDLISEVSQRPGLWDHDHPDYRFKNVKTKLWRDIVKKLTSDDTGMTKTERRELETQISRKWKGIRDNFQRQYSKSSKAKRPYLYTRELQFLLKNKMTMPTDTVAIKKEADSIEEVSSETDGEKKHSSQAAWKPRKKFMISITDNVRSDDDGNTFDFQECNDGSARNHSEIESSSQHFAYANVDAMISCNQDDADKMFLLSLLPHLKSLPEEFRLSAKMEIMQVLQAANCRFTKPNN